jgi:putative ABC transport system permease protein
MMGIALAVGTAVALLALGRGIVDSVTRGFDEHGTEMVVSPRSSTDILTSRLPEAMAGELLAIGQVAEVWGELYAFGVAGSGEHILAAGWPEGAALWRDAPLASGRVPQRSGEVLLGDVAARVLGVETGSPVWLFDQQFQVVGVADYATATNRGLAIMLLPDLQEASLRPDQVSFFSVRLEPGVGEAEIAAVSADIESRLPVIVSSAEQVMADDQNIAILRAVSNAVSAIALVMGALSLLSTQLISVQERTREIGMIAAMGWSDGRVIALIVIEGLVIGVAGCAGGVGVGVAASRLFDAIPAIGNLISFTPRAADLVWPLLLAIPLCAAGAAYPAWRAVSLQPAEALRQA